MARNESNTENSAAAVAEKGEEEAYQYDIKIEDAGPATKKVVVQIPKERVAEKLTEQFKEIRQQAAIPGFRPGHAPQKLVEKRFGDDVKDQVRRSLLSESYQQAVEKNSLNVIGEPEFDNPEAIQLKEAEGLSYSFQIEVQPEITIPELKGIKVKRPKIDVTDTNVSVNGDSQTGLVAGLTFNMPVQSMFSVEVDALFAQKGTKFTFAENGFVDTGKMKLN